MLEQTATLANIRSRLERLEKQNRRLKQIALGCLALLGAMFLMGQAHPNRTIEAQAFILKDADGKARAKLGMETGGPTLLLLDAKETPQISVAAGERPFVGVSNPNGQQLLALGSFSPELFGLMLYGKDNGPPLHGIQMGLGVFKGVPHLDLHGEVPEEEMFLDPGGFDLTDKQGFETKIGRTSLETPRTGETHETSAASIVLFGKGSKVLWSAP